MLTVFIVVFVVMSLTVAIMAIGVIFGREPIKGSCGGLNNVGVERACGCKEVCEQEVEQLQASDMKKTEASPNIHYPQ